MPTSKRTVGQTRQHAIILQVDNKEGNILYQVRSMLDAHDGAIRRALKGALIMLGVAIVLELTLFNVNFYRTFGYEEIDLSDRLDLSVDDEGNYRLTQFNHTMEFEDLNVPVHNIHLALDQEQPAQLLDFHIMFTDEAHLTYFDDTDYTTGVPDATVSTVSPESMYVHLSPSGAVRNLSIQLVDDGVAFPVRLEGISINAPEPFSFNSLRVTVVFFVLFLIFLFRPKSLIFRINLRDEPVFTKRAIIVAVLVEVYLISSFLFFGSNLVGIATKSYNYGSWDRESIVSVYDAAGDNAQQYSMLAEAIAHGQLYLEEEPPQWLQELDDPYDKGARDEAQKAQGGDYLFDVAYYNGHYYVYFGIVPELLFYLPFYVLTGAHFPTAIGILIAMIAFVCGCTALLDRFARHHFKRVNLGVFLLLQIPLVICSGMLYLVKFPTFYSLPIMCGLAFSIWGLYLWLRGRSSARPEGWYLGGSLCMALVVGCRPQLMVLSLLAFPLFWRRYVSERRLFTASGARQFACLIVPYVLVIAGVMWYNAARFGSPFDFGANYNLTVHNMTKRGLAFGRIAPAVFAYFLQPPCADGTFPFLMAVPFDTTYMGQTVREATFGGIFACLPVLWLLLFAWPIIKMRRKDHPTNTVAGTIVVLIASGVLVAIFDAELAGILQRYFADFSFMFLAAAVLLAFIVNERVHTESATGRALRLILLVVVGVSVLYSTLLCFVPEIGWYSDVYGWAYQNVIESFEFWT